MKKDRGSCLPLFIGCIIGCVIWDFLSGPALYKRAIEPYYQQIYLVRNQASELVKAMDEGNNKKADSLARQIAATSKLRRRTEIEEAVQDFRDHLKASGIERAEYPLDHVRQ